MDMTTLKELILTRHEGATSLNECSQADYPLVLKRYYKANIDVVEYSNTWVSEQDVGLIIFEINGRTYQIKAHRKGYKYIGYITEKEVK